MVFIPCKGILRPGKPPGDSPSQLSLVQALAEGRILVFITLAHLAVLFTRAQPLARRSSQGGHLSSQGSNWIVPDYSGVVGPQTASCCRRLSFSSLTQNLVPHVSCTLKSQMSTESPVHRVTASQIWGTRSTRHSAERLTWRTLAPSVTAIVHVRTRQCALSALTLGSAGMCPSLCHLCLRP